MTNGQGGRSLWRWMRENKDQIQIAAIIVAALWTLHLYGNAIEDGKRRESLKYVEMIHSSSLSESYCKLNEYWLTKEGLERLEKTDEDWSPMAEEFLHENNLEMDFYRLLQFYLSMTICSNSGTCDTDILCAAFFNELDSFLEFNRKYLKRLSDVHGLDVSELRRFKLRCCERMKDAHLKNCPGAAKQASPKAPSAKRARSLK